MSKKGKLILATALFGAALFGASCGGGGGTASTPPPPPPPPPGVDGQVLALLEVGTASAGPLMPVAICQLRSDNKVICGTDLSPANLDLYYVHEFQNGNVLLYGPGNVLYLFDGSRVKRLDTFRTLDVATTSTDAGGIAVPSGAFISRLPNLVMMFGAGGAFVAVAENGTVIRESTSVGFVGAACPTVTKGGNTYRISADGSVSSLTPSRTIAQVLASAGGKFLVYGSDNRLYLRDDPCLPDGLSISVVPIPNVQDAQMVRVGNDFYIAVREDVDNVVFYFKVTDGSSTLLANPTISAGGRFGYTLDGQGRLYATATAANRVDVYDRNNLPITTAPLDDDVVGMLGFADRVLVKDDSDNFYDITPTAAFTNMGSSDAILRNHFNNCTNGTHTKVVDGIGTNFIRCMFDDGAAPPGGQRLSSIAFVGGQYRRPSALANITSAAHTAANQFDILFGANALIVRNAESHNIHLCTTTSTTSPSISCSDTGVRNASGRPLGFADFSTLSSSYLKSSGSEVFYRSGTTLFVGDVFNPTPISSISVDSASGGNASFNLNKFAFSFRPADVPGSCNTQIAYLSSRTASPKYYALPSGTCVIRILKTFP